MGRGLVGNRCHQGTAMATAEMGQALSLALSFPTQLSSYHWPLQYGTNQHQDYSHFLKNPP